MTLLKRSWKRICFGNLLHNNQYGESGETRNYKKTDFTFFLFQNAMD